MHVVGEWSKLRIAFGPDPVDDGDMMGPDSDVGDGHMMGHDSDSDSLDYWHRMAPHAESDDEVFWIGWQSLFE